MAIIHSEGSLPNFCSEVDTFPWFYGPLSCNASEILLKYHRNGTFLVRDNEACAGLRILSVCFEGQVHHYKIYEDTKHRQVFLWWNRQFRTISHLVHHYSCRKEGIITRLDYPPDETTVFDVRKSLVYRLQRIDKKLIVSAWYSQQDKMHTFGQTVNGSFHISKTVPEQRVLSIYHEGHAYHYKMCEDKETKKVYMWSNQRFNTINELVRHHSVAADGLVTKLFIPHGTEGVDDLHANAASGQEFSEQGVHVDEAMLDSGFHDIKSLRESGGITDRKTRSDGLHDDAAGGQVFSGQGVHVDEAMLDSGFHDIQSLRESGGITDRKTRPDDLYDDAASGQVFSWQGVHVDEAMLDSGFHDIQSLRESGCITERKTRPDDLYDDAASGQVFSGQGVHVDEAMLDSGFHDIQSLRESGCITERKTRPGSSVSNWEQELQGEMEENAHKAQTERTLRKLAQMERTKIQLQTRLIQQIKHTDGAQRIEMQCQLTDVTEQLEQIATMRKCIAEVTDLQIGLWEITDLQRRHYAFPPNFNVDEAERVRMQNQHADVGAQIKRLFAMKNHDAGEMTEKGKCSHKKAEWVGCGGTDSNMRRTKKIIPQHLKVDGTERVRMQHLLADAGKEVKHIVARRNRVGGELTQIAGRCRVCGNRLQNVKAYNVD